MAMTREEFNQACGRGSVLLALRDLDPEGAGVLRGDTGVCFESAEIYGEGKGPLVRWVSTIHDAVYIRGICNVYPGDADIMLSVAVDVSLRTPMPPWTLG